MRPGSLDGVLVRDAHERVHVVFDPPRYRLDRWAWWFVASWVERAWVAMVNVGLRIGRSSRRRAVTARGVVMLVGFNGRPKVVRTVAEPGGGAIPQRRDPRRHRNRN